MSSKAVVAAKTGVEFTLRDDLVATEPPEARGLDRAEVRLLVARPDAITHSRFHGLADQLAPGDLVVVNTSATVPAALPALRGDGQRVVVHVSSSEGDHGAIVELRSADGAARLLDGVAGERLGLTGGGGLTLRRSYPDVAEQRATRLWRAAFAVPHDVLTYLRTWGHPIRYGYVRQAWPLSSYQTVFARYPGSAEMASAGRPFTDALVTELVTRGVRIAPITLHTGVSSLEAGERPLPERFEVPSPTARLVNETRAAGGRVVAVGTTVTRALESACDAGGVIRPARGVTTLVLDPAHPARVVTGLITGWHDPQASHLLLLQAVAGWPLVRAAYDAALAGRYLWHEFGDSALLLP